MDPVENIREQLRLATGILDGADAEDGHDPLLLENSAERLAELVLAMDEWRRMGGFDPYSREVTW